MSPDDPRHGTEAGSREHYRHGEKPCDPCREDHRRRNILRQMYPAKRPAIGSQRRIQALQAIGYSRYTIARELGYSDNGSISYLMRADTLLATTAERIADVYDRLCMTIPTGAGATRARTWAKRNGYAPPLAWNDPDIDEHPRGLRPTESAGLDPVVVDRILAGDWRLACTPAEKAAVCKRWVAADGTLGRLERLTGWRTARYYRKGEAA